MIGRLTGKLLRKATDHLIVDVGGVGYLVTVPLSSYYELPEEGQQTSLNIYTHVREDMLALYGFITDHEQRLFELLLSISGIGPKLACNILSGIGSDELALAIAGSDIARLNSIPGVGKKTAERIVLELKDKAARLGAETSQQLPPATGTSVFDDAVSALINLGYNKVIAEKAVGMAVKESDEFEEVIRNALGSLAK